MSLQERLDKFYRFCQSQITDIQEQLERLGESDGQPAERLAAITTCSSAINRLSNTVRESSSFLPAHDQKTYSDVVKLLSDKLQETRAALKPRTKFAFKTKKNASAISLADVEGLVTHPSLRPGWQSSNTSETSSAIGTPAEQPPSSLEPPVSEPVFSASEPDEIRRPEFEGATSIKLAHHTSEHIILPSTASHATTSNGTLTNLTSCVVDMAAPTSSPTTQFSGLVLKNISRSLIICGHVNGPAHLTGVEDSVVVVACRQFRMHESRGVDVYLWCGSRPIIEACEGVRFAPLPSCFVTESDQKTENRYDQVDDFKWLKAEKNPNWDVLVWRDRIGDEVWQDVVNGSTGLGCKEILEAVN